MPQVGTKKSGNPLPQVGTQKQRGGNSSRCFFFQESRWGNLENLRIYRVDDKYVYYLHGAEHRVQYNKGNRRPYVGVVLHIGGFRYFVPMESPKPNHANIKAGKHIAKLEGGKYGLLGFNNMIPVCDSALIDFDIDNEPDGKYRELLKHQVRVCNKNKADIMDRAQKTYFDVVNGKNKFLIKISCDFRKLERACGRYDPNFKKKKKKASTSIA